MGLSFKHLFRIFCDISDRQKVDPVCFSLLKRFDRPVVFMAQGDDMDNFLNGLHTGNYVNDVNDSIVKRIYVNPACRNYCHKR